MQLVTVQDGFNAVDQLLQDISATAAQVNAAASSSNFITGFFGSDSVAVTSASVLAQLSQSAQRAADDLSGSSIAAPLNAEQINRLGELQDEVISDRALIGQAISSVDWTFGDLVSDVATQTKNIASQTVAAVSSGLNINWTVVELGLAGVALVLAYALYKRVRG